MIRSSQQAAYGLGYLASLTRTGNKPYDVDYSAQAREDFARYASMTEQELVDVLNGRVRRGTGTPKKIQIKQLLDEQPQMTYREIAMQVRCHPEYVYKVVKGAR